MPFLFDVLSKLEIRGYYFTGITLRDVSQNEIIKKKDKLKFLLEKTDSIKSVKALAESNILVGHLVLNHLQLTYV